MVHRYERMYPAEFIRAVEEMPVFYVPLGLLEWHGDHLPLGLDALKAHGICVRLAEAVGGGIVLPPTYYGRPGYSSYIGTLTYSEALIQDMLHGLLTQLRKVGAKVVLLLTGHYGPAQLEAVKRGADVFMREHPGMIVLAQAEYDGVLVNGQPPCDHAGIWETSLMMALAPEMVRMDALKSAATPPQQYCQPPYDYYHETGDWQWNDSLHEASAALGAQALEAIVYHLCGQVTDALQTIHSMKKEA